MSNRDKNTDTHPNDDPAHVPHIQTNDDHQQQQQQERKQKQLARLEIHIRTLVGLLTAVVHATISFLEVKQTRTPEELQAEILDEEEHGYSDVEIDHGGQAGGDDDDEQPFYNPLNLPLGWDGKPIPYWLYKLHGLGVEYKCEICGNHSYWGRRDFDHHFQQWRHAFGMRCLGIPNTKHFHDITLMQDAIDRKTIDYIYLEIDVLYLSM